MKTAWNIITLVALANLIAIVGFVVWLHFSGRLDLERVERVRTMMSETIAQESKRLSSADAATEAERLLVAQEAALDGPPVTASESLSIRLETSEIEAQKKQRLDREISDLRETLARERRLFENEQSDYLREKTEFERMRERIAEIEGDEQFAKSVAVLDSVKSSEARDMLGELFLTDPQQVVSYLNAMKPRARTAVIAAFNKDGQTDLATDLLEMLRVHGLEAVGQ